MTTVNGKLALVTGASSGIGKAVAAALAEKGAELLVVGRSRERLQAAEIPGATPLVADLADRSSVGDLLDSPKLSDGVDLLVHSAGAYARAPFASTTLADLDRQMHVAVHGPLLLTQGLLPGLRQRRGQIVFVNSSVRGSAGVTAYSASKYAQRAMAESLRAEENSNGIRVLTVYPGRTATPMQQRVCEAEGREYDAESLAQPEDVAQAVVDAMELPPSAEITDLRIRSARKH